MNTPDRFNQLPEETKTFLSRLHGEDVKLLEEGISLVRSIRTVGIFVKWLLVAFLGMIVGAVALWEAVIKLFHLRGGP